MDFIYAALPLALLVSYLGLQVWSLRRFAGGWWYAACVPAGAMVAAVLVAVIGGLSGSNLAPIWVVFTLPVALLALVALAVLRWLFSGGRG